MPGATSILPSSYGTTLKASQLRIRQERVRAVLSANSALVQLYWEIGRVIADRQSQEKWGAKVIDRLARDLRKSFPAMQGFSTRNLLSMRSVAEEYPDMTIVKQLVSQLPWARKRPLTLIRALHEKLDIAPALLIREPAAVYRVLRRRAG